MLLIIGSVIVLVSVVVALGIRVRGAMDRAPDAPRGTVSERWLAEHRASQSP
jgi:hypothetical protein